MMSPCYSFRYVLDGDREELRNIRHELANLRSVSAGQVGGPRQGQQQGQGQGQGQMPLPHPVRAQEQPSQYEQGAYQDTQQYQINYQQRSAYAQPYVRESIPPTTYQNNDRHEPSLNVSAPAGAPQGAVLSPKGPDSVLGPRGVIAAPAPHPYSYRTSSTAVSSLRTIEETGFSSEEEEEEEEERPRSWVRQAEAPPTPLTADSNRSSYRSEHLSGGSSPVPTQTAHTGTREQLRSRAAQQDLETETVRNLRQQIQDLLETGVYDDEDDPVIQALRAELREAERDSTPSR